MAQSPRFENQPARRIAKLRDVVSRRSRILGGKVAAARKATEQLPLFSPASSTDVETLDLSSRYVKRRLDLPHSWFGRQLQRFTRAVNVRRNVELHRQRSQRRLLQEARDLRHVAARHHSLISKNRTRIRVLEHSVAKLIAPRHVANPDAAGPKPSIFRGGCATTRITLVAPWYDCMAWPDTTKTTADQWWRWLPDHLARNLAQRGYQVEMLTTCVRDPESNWWVNELPIGTEYHDGVLVHRFGVNDEGEERYQQLAKIAKDEQRLSSDQQAELLRCGINSDALVQYARGRIAETAVVCIGSVHGLSYDLVHALDGHSVLISGPIAEPSPGWDTSRDIMASAGRILFWNEDDRQLAIQYYGHDLGPRLISAAVLGPLFDDGSLDAASRPGSTEDRRQWDCIIDRLVLGVAQSCAS